MGEMQATVGGTDLDNGDWRKIHGSQEVSEGTDGKVTCTIDFLIEADNADTLQSRINTTFAAFRKHNPACVVTLDSAASNKMRSITAGDGTHLAVMSTVVADPQFPPTANSVGMTLVIIAELAIPSSLAITGLESLQFVEVFNSARSRVRQLVGSFFSTSGSTAEANYLAARSSLLTTYMLCASTGAYDPTNKFVLVDEKRENPGALGLRLEFALESEYQVFPMTNTESARSSTIKISTSVPDEWDARGGARPTLITATGAVSTSLTVLQTGVLAAWATVELDVKAAILAETGKGDLASLKIETSSDADTGLLEFSATYVSGNAVVLRFSLNETVTDVIDSAEAEDSEGYDYVQLSPKPIKRSRAVVVERVGVGKIDLDLILPTPRPTLPDHNAADIVGRVVSCAGPITTEFGEIYKQTATYTIRERKVRDALAPLPFPVPIFGG